MAAETRLMGVSLKVVVLAAVITTAIIGAIWAAIGFASGVGQDPTTRSTVVIGDSITRLSAEAVVAEVDAEVVAYNSAKWADLGPAIAPVLSKHGEPPERVAVLLGANDVLDLTMALTDFAAVLDPLSEVPCVVVLELPKTLGGLSRGFNAALRDEVAQHPNAVTDDRWSVTATDNLERADGTWFDEDGIHPNAVGQRKLAESYASALDRHCASAAG